MTTSMIHTNLYIYDNLMNYELFSVHALLDYVGICNTKCKFLKTWLKSYIEIINQPLKKTRHITIVVNWSLRTFNIKQ